MTQEEIETEYKIRLPLYERALENVKQALMIFLQDDNIQFLGINGRIKTLDSFLDKIERKNYEDPFDKNEDFCGIRIIVYYPNDIKKIQEIIKKEFDVQTQFNKADELEVNEFGYRSEHSIVKIKSDWLLAPNYRGLKDIKIEIQARTILMHAWAEVEHKLVYKKKSQIPRELQRQLFMLSAKFEEADTQFETIKLDIETYRENLNKEIQKTDSFKNTTELNYDSLITIMNYYLPEYPRNESQAISVLNDLTDKKYNLLGVENLLKKIKPIAAEINKEIFPEKKLRLSQATLLTYAMDIFAGINQQKLYTKARLRRLNTFMNKYNKDGVNNIKID